MGKVTLEAKSRTESGKKAAKALRAAGHIPAVVYNSSGEAKMLDVDATEFNKIWRSVTSTTLITLTVDGTAHEVFIKDVEYNIRTDAVLHADFWEPAANRTVTLNVSKEAEEKRKEFIKKIRANVQPPLPPQMSVEEALERYGSKPIDIDEEAVNELRRISTL